MSDDSIDLLFRSRAALVEVDFWTVDDLENLTRSAHTGLLGSNIPIVEHLTNLSSLPERGFKFYAVPPPIVKRASFLARAFAQLEL